jgi:hypothetical protein
MVLKFEKDDERYKQWRESHPDGFVFNDNKIHRALCPELNRKPQNARPDNPFTTTYRKICADTEGELRAHVNTDRRCTKC